jgi:hypothetical protein
LSDDAGADVGELLCDCVRAGFEQLASVRSVLRTRNAEALFISWKV